MRNVEASMSFALQASKKFSKLKAARARECAVECYSGGRKWNF